MVEFAYAVGRIRSLEALMLSDQHFLRMAEARDFESAFMVLSESCYSKITDQMKKSFDFTELIQLEYESVKHLLFSLAKDSDVFPALFQRLEDPNIDDAQYLTTLKSIAEKLQSPLFTQYVKAFSILNELKTSLRNIDPNTLDGIIEKYKYTDYYHAVLNGINEFKKSGSLFIFEKETDNLLIENIRKAKYKAFGIEPLIGFFIGKEMEFKNIKLILTGKLLGADPLEIKSRIRKSYV